MTTAWTLLFLHGSSSISFQVLNLLPTPSLSYCSWVQNAKIIWWSSSSFLKQTWASWWMGHCGTKCPHCWSSEFQKKRRRQDHVVHTQLPLPQAPCIMASCASIWVSLNLRSSNTQILTQLFNFSCVHLSLEIIKYLGQCIASSESHKHHIILNNFTFWSKELIY